MTSIYSELSRPELGRMAPYAPVAGNFAVRLDANEAPDALSEESKRKLAECAAKTSFHRYPDATQAALREALAQRSGVTPAEIVAGSGSDEIITLLMTAFCRPQGKSPVATVLTTTPSFVMYRMCAQARGLRAIEVPLDERWDLAVDAMLRAIEITEPTLVFIASPNNPTGTCASQARLRTIVQAASQALVVIDEAYVDYAANDACALYQEFPNVALLRTLSKIGFAALRVGWLIGRPACINLLDAARLPYNLSAASQALAVLAVTDLVEDVRRVTRGIVEERERLQHALQGFDALSTTPSQANFLWVKTNRPAEEIFTALKEKGVLVRSFHDKGGRLAQQLRITVGTRAENDRLLDALAEVL